LLKVLNSKVPFYFLKNKLVLILKLLILLVRRMDEILDKSIYRTEKFRCKYE